MGSVHVEYNNQAAILTIDNPPLNALSKEIIDSLENALDELDMNKARVLVITGAGEKSFVAGADISQFPELKQKTGQTFVERGQSVYRKLAHLPLPVICAINGYALGGGLELALSCDIRVASENARLGLPEATLGILPGYGGTQRLPRLIGAGMAKKLLFTGEPVKAEEALRIGLVEAVVPTGKALEEALLIAGRIASAAAPISVREIKTVVDHGLEVPLDDGIALEAAAFGRLCETDDKNEGVAAFFEKRKAVFTNK